MQNFSHGRRTPKASSVTFVLSLIAVLLLGACQPVAPATTAPSADALATYTDANGIFTAEYPADWVVQPYLFDDTPLPHVGIGSNQAIMDASMATAPLPEGEIGVALMLMPAMLFAEAGVDASTPLDAVLEIVLMGMAEDPDEVAALLAGAEIELVTLANGTPAAQAVADAPTEAYLMTLADLGDGLYLFASQIQALDYHDAAQEARIAAIVESFRLTASADDVLAYVTGQMGMEAVAESAMESAGAPTVTFTAVEDEAGYRYEGPASIPGGLTRVELDNPGESEHGLWLARLDEGRTFEDMMGVMMSEDADGSIPDWLGFYGGVTVEPGGASAYTIDLPAGNYVLFSISGFDTGEPDFMRGMVSMLSVEAAPEAAVALPQADVRTEMVDFSYIIEGTLHAGAQLVEVTNTGMEPHEIILVKLADGATIADVTEFMMAEESAEGPPPFEMAGGTGPMSAGVVAWYELEFAAGEYGVICFVSSPANQGAPHFMLGMAQQVTVAP